MNKPNTPGMLAIRMTITRRPKVMPWSPEEDARLRNILADKGFNGAAFLLARTPKAIRARAAKLGLKAKGK